MLEFKQVSTGGGDSCGCTRCRAPRLASFDPAAEVEPRLAGLSAVSLGGPDALLHPELPRLVAAASATASRIRLETQAGGFTVGGNAEGALHAGVRHVEVTVLGAEATHDRLSGRRGTLDTMAAGLTAFREAARHASLPVVVWARVPVCGHNRGDLTGSVGAALSLGVDIVTIDCAASRVDVAAEAAALLAACDTATVNGIWCVLEGVPFCLVPGFELHVGAVLGHRDELVKARVCSACDVDGFCPGFSASAPDGVAAAVSPPLHARRLAARVSFARGAAQDA